jgi:L-ascorbate metabolism protein UlaG (beta-lactamase superfamily)
VKRLFGRRAFLVTTTAAGVGGAWTAMGPSWSSRFLRERVAEIGREVPPAPHKPDPGSWSDNAITLAWLGHATVLFNFYGVPAELPEIDLVLVSHAHFDHLDTPSLAAVRGRSAAVMGASTSDLLPEQHYSSVRELRWNSAATVRTPKGDVLVRSIEVKHWGARVRRDTWRGYTGWIVEREGRKILIGGDTAATPLFAEHRRFGPFEAAVMPIGAYDPWIRNHCTPEQGVAMANACGARLFVPVHHQTFELSREPFMEPIERTQEALVKEPERLAVREIGQAAVIG